MFKVQPHPLQRTTGSLLHCRRSIKCSKNDCMHLVLFHLNIGRYFEKEMNQEWRQRRKDIFHQIEWTLQRLCKVFQVGSAPIKSDWDEGDAKQSKSSEN